MTAPFWGTRPRAYRPSARHHQSAASPRSETPLNARAKGTHSNDAGCPNCRCGEPHADKASKKPSSKGTLNI